MTVDDSAVSRAEDVTLRAKMIRRRDRDQIAVRRRRTSCLAADDDDNDEQAVSSSNCRLPPPPPREAVHQPPPGRTVRERKRWASRDSTPVVYIDFN